MCLRKFVPKIYPLNRTRHSGEYLNLMEKIHNKELHNLHTSPHIIRVLKAMRQDGSCSMHGEITYSYNLVGKPERKGQIGRPGHSWKHANNIKTGLTGVWYEGVD
jgi:hypothetical protein